MAAILMNVETPNGALETLLYVFKNQMSLGKDSLTLTLKHKDGYRDWVRGKVDSVFKSELSKEIEGGDILILEHFKNDDLCIVRFSQEINSLERLLLAAKSVDRCCSFIMPKGNSLVFFVFKDHPMNRYRINENDIISDKILGKSATTLNNVAGKIDSKAGMFSAVSTYTR